MNQYEYVSLVMSNVHEAIEGWARNLLRSAGIETTEVYGQFPPEGSVASHIVLFPYRLGGPDKQLSTPYQEISLMTTKGAKGGIAGMPNVWSELGLLFTNCIMEKYPRVTKGPHTGRPHPAPRLETLPEPLKKWYTKQGDSGQVDSWLTDLGGSKYARLPSLVWVPGASLKLSYLIVVGEGARGTSEREAPVAIQALSVLAAGVQMQRRVSVRIPAPPFDRDIISYAEAVVETFDDPDLKDVLNQLDDVDEDTYLPVTLLPSTSLTNSDFTSLMQALQRPLQPTLHLSVQLNVGGAPIFAPGINADVRSEQKERRKKGR